MSIFSKKLGDLIPNVNSLDVSGTSSDNNPSNLDYGKFQPMRYTIEQAVELVSSLKNHNVSARVIAGVMKQTLESVDIHFSDIVADAQRKESAINSETSKKDEMIKELTRKVEALQMEKVKYQKDLNRIVYVREFLQQAIADEESEESAQAKPGKPGLQKAEAGLPANSTP